MIIKMNYRKIVSIARMFALFLLYPSQVLSQENFSGYITNHLTNEPVQGATIEVDNTFYKTTTDGKGYFSMQGVLSGTVNVTITHIAFNILKTEIHAGKENKLVVVPKTYLTEEVNITATRTQNNTGASFTLLDKAEIEKNNTGQDIPFLLNLTPSVVSTSDAGTGIGYTGLRIRGSDATRLNVTINGIPVNDAESHQVYWVDLPDLASSVQDIHVQRGIGNSTNGAGAFGGSINIQTGKLRQDAFGEISSSAGSFNTFKNTISFGSGIISDVFAIDGRLSKIVSDGYIDRANSDLQSYYLSGGYYGKKNSIRAVVFSGKEKTYQAWYGVPEDSLKTNRTYNPAGEYYTPEGNVEYYENQTDNYKQDNYQLLYSQVLNKSLTGNFALHYTKGEGYYEEYKADDSFQDYGLPPVDIGDSTITNADIIRQRWLSNDFYGFTFSLEYENKDLNIKAGGAGNAYKGDHYGEIIAAEIMNIQDYPYRYYFDASEKNELNLFVKTTYRFDKVITAWIDLQNRMLNYTFEGLNENYSTAQQEENLNFFNPKAGLNFDLRNNLAFYFFAGIGQKEPVRDDYVNSIPSKRPEPEYMTDFETGGSYNSRSFSVTANLFYMNYRDQLILNGKINDVGEYVRENVKDSYRAGIEMEAAYIFSNTINIKAGVSLSKNRIKSYNEYVDDYDGGPQLINTYSNTVISFSPEVTSTMLLHVNPIKNFSFDLTGKYTGKQYLDNTKNENRKLDPYFTSDLRLNYNILLKKIRVFELSFSVLNLPDTKYSSNGYSYSGYSGGLRYDYNYYFPQAGRYWMAGVRIGI
jgi:iron complex outermembrane recepter protein